MSSPRVPRVLMGHPALNANVRQAALGLAEAGMLAEFQTGLDLTSLSTSPIPRVAALASLRSLPPEVHAVTRTSSLPELTRVVIQRQRLITHANHEGRLSAAGRHAAMARRLATRVTNGSFDAVYAYEDAAFEAFEASQLRGMPAILDMPVPYWRSTRALMEEEVQLTPAWASTIDAIADSPARLERKDRELALASTVLVASSFAASTLKSSPLRDGGGLTIAPYGAVVSADPASRPQPTSGPLRVLFVGRLSQAKGIGYFFDAIARHRRHIEVTVIGDGRDLHNAALTEHMRGVTWMRSAGHHDVLAQMARHDVLVLPTLYDGFGLVLAEALGAGTPIISTAHSAAPDLLAQADPDNAPPGWVVPTRDANAISAVLDDLIASPEMRTAASESALELARQLSWEAYRQRVAHAVAVAYAEHNSR